MGNDRHRSRWLAAAAAAGLLAAIGLPPLGWPLLVWPALALLWALAAAPLTAPGAAMAGLVWGLAAVLTSHRWLLWLHPLDWIGVPGPLSLPICTLLWLGCGLAAGALTALWVLLVRRLDPRRVSTAVLAASLWGLAEVLLARGPLFWIGLGVSALPGDRALAGVGALAGAGAIACLQLLIGWCLWRLLSPSPQRLRWGLAGALLVLLAHLLGLSALAAAAAPVGRSELLLVLQPAIPTRQKFEVAQQLELLGQLAAAQRQAPAAVASLLLPEGALALGQPLPESKGPEVLSGGFRRQGEQQRSALLRFAPGEPQPSGWVDKHRLVPLGEWVPLAGLARWSGLSAVGGLEPGPASRLLPRPAGTIGVAICYELADGTGLAAAARDGARWLVASANLDPYPRLLQAQFAAVAQLRAIETGRWLVSAANTGPSLVVDAGGRVRQQLPAGRRQLGLMTLRQRSQLTPYDRWGELPLLALAAGAALARWRLGAAAPGPGR
jgi:apolipoprotein N-acyltransferase